ncbi:hypothetical protein [Melghirimyces algeriensis]|nr:hypothetical protein [Melghirimyces algeriensis]
MKQTPSTSLLEDRDAETDISPSPLCHEPQKPEKFGFFSFAVS